jgi:kynurenine formamidase
MAIRWIDLSQPIYNGMPRAGLLDVPKLTPKQIDIGQPDMTVQITDMSFATHTGTHIDAPLHFFPGGKTLDDYPLEAFVGPGRLLRVSKEPFGVIAREDLINAGEEVRPGDVVLIRTGWGAKYGQPDYETSPSLGEDAARWLVECGARIMGIDTLTPELAYPKRPKGYAFPIHRILLGNGVLIIEHLNLERLPVAPRMTVAAFPLPIRGADGAPARVVGMVEESP